MGEASHHKPLWGLESGFSSDSEMVNPGYSRVLPARDVSHLGPLVFVQNLSFGPDLMRASDIKTKCIFGNKKAQGNGKSFHVKSRLESLLASFKVDGDLKLSLVHSR
jgi:hypothetical protein